MIKRVLVLVVGVFICTTVLAQQVDVSGKDFESGAGDARLAQIARQAAAQGKVLSVTTPSYWQAKVKAKLRAGDAGVAIRMNSGFFENVLVRIVDSKSKAPENARREVENSQAAKAAAEAKAKAREKRAAEARAAAQKAAAARRAEADRIAAQQAAEEKARADQLAAKLRAQQQAQAAARAAAAKAAAEKAAAEKVAAAKAAAAKAEADRIARIRRTMRKNLNNGQPADGNLAVSQLQRGDQIYVNGSIRGVVRRSGARIGFYWLQGSLNLDRIELMPSGNGRYSVLRPIEDVAHPVLRTRVGGHLLAKVPAAGSSERRSMQQRYAEGRDISSTLRPSELHSGDVIYTGESAAVVVRRAPGSLLRFWLVGDLNLGQVGLLKQGDNAYRALSDTIK